MLLSPFSLCPSHPQWFFISLRNYIISCLRALVRATRTGWNALLSAPCMTGLFWSFSFSLKVTTEKFFSTTVLTKQSGPKVFSHVWPGKIVIHMETSYSLTYRSEWQQVNAQKKDVHGEGQRERLICLSDDQIRNHSLRTKCSIFQLLGLKTKQNIVFCIPTFEKATCFEINDGRWRTWVNWATMLMLVSQRKINNKIIPTALYFPSKETPDTVWLRCAGLFPWH